MSNVNYTLNRREVRLIGADEAWGRGNNGIEMKCHKKNRSSLRAVCEESTLKAYVLLCLREIASAAPPFVGAMA